MPVHDWSQVDATIFQHFQIAWISQIQRALNGGILPAPYYALAEQQTQRLEPDVLTLRGLEGPREEVGPIGANGSEDGGNGAGGGVGVEVALQRAAPRVARRDEGEVIFTPRRERAVVVRHVSGDDVVAMIEIVSPGNKDRRRALEAFIEKVGWLLTQGVHQLVLDVHRPGRHDPMGIHPAIWSELTGRALEPLPDRPLGLVAYEQEGERTRAYSEAAGVGDRLPAMPLFLRPGGYVEVPLEATYAAAFAAVPRRWRDVLDGGGDR